MKITTVGIDLAKHVFQIHGMDEQGKAMLKKQVKREQMAAFFVNLPPCLIGMEACGSAHHWARKLQEMGHTVRLMAPQFVKPYVKSNKNDAADAEAICEAVGRPNMRFVPIKNVAQQSVLALHRARQGFVRSAYRASQSDPRFVGRVRPYRSQGVGAYRQAGPGIDRGCVERADGIVSPTRAASCGASARAGQAGRRVGTADQGMASGKRSQQPLGEDSRDRPDHGRRIGSNDWRCQEFLQRPAGRGLAGPGSQAALQWWQGRVARHE